ncbi:hypothetical protein J4G37_06980 [Microvirga sp. 3-52]|nr:hypothetical protein [Microvirga sp. 3-52]
MRVGKPQLMHDRQAPGHFLPRHHRPCAGDPDAEKRLHFPRKVKGTRAHVSL